MTKTKITNMLYDRLMELIRMDKAGVDIAGNTLTHDTEVVISAKISELIHVLSLLGLDVDIELFYMNTGK